MYEPQYVLSTLVELDYLSSLAEGYILEAEESPLNIPKVELFFVDAVRLLKNIQAKNKEQVMAKDLHEIFEQYSEYVEFKSKSCDNQDVSALLAFRLMSSVNGAIKNIAPIGFPFPLYIVKKEAEFLYIGVEDYHLSSNSHQEYVKIIASMRNGYYFQDVNGTPYLNGDVIFVRLRVPDEWR
jgi:hypothetical protein